MQARLYIAIPCRDRRKIIEQCIPTIAETKASGDFLTLWNDGSTEYPPEFLSKWADRVLSVQKSHGIEAQRKAHFTYYWEQRHAFTHIYLTDSDALHDPNWRANALGLQQEHGGVPVCLYNTPAHVRMAGNTIEDNAKSNVIWRRYAPGVSYLLTMAHMESVMRHIDLIQNWDWDVPRILGNRFAISRVSYVDHLGAGGMHHPANEGYDGGDRALNPTDWLKVKRYEAVAELEKA